MLADYAADTLPQRDADADAAADIADAFDDCRFLSHCHC